MAMKSIDEYLLGSSRPKVSFPFPDKYDEEAILDFLESNNFKRVSHEDRPHYDVVNDMQKTRGRSYMYVTYPNHYFLAFSNGGQISEDNPVFAINTAVIGGIYYEISHIDQGRFYYNEYEFKEFADIVNKHFGLK